MIYMTRTQKSIAAAAILILVVISGTMYIRQEKATEISLGKGIEVNTEDNAVIAPTPAEEKISEISVYICGHVKEPQVVTVREGTRLGEALEMIGGPNEEADLDNINLAYKLVDEDMVYIPEKGEKLEVTAKFVPGANTGQAAAGKNGKININTAGESELDRLEGVGPATAKAIIKYREQNGPFKSIEEIMNVSGIGNSKFNAIKDIITVD